LVALGYLMLRSLLLARLNEVAKPATSPPAVGRTADKINFAFVCVALCEHRQVVQRHSVFGVEGM